MKKLSKVRVAQKAELSSSLQDAFDALAEAIDNFNSKAQEEYCQVEEARDAYNEVVNNWNSFREEVKGEQDEHYDPKSDRWKEGEKGQA